MKKTIIYPLTNLLFLSIFSYADPVNFNLGSELENEFQTTGSAISQTTSEGLNGTAAIAFSTTDTAGYATQQTKSLVTSTLEGDFTIRQLAFFKTGTRQEFERDRRRAFSIGLTSSDSVNHEGGEFLAQGAVYSSVYVTDAVAEDSKMSVKLAFTTSQPNVYRALTGETYELNQDAWYALRAEYLFPAGLKTMTVLITLHKSNDLGEIGETLATLSSSTTEIEALFGEDAVLKGFFGTVSANRTNIAIIDEIELLELEYTPPPPPNTEEWRSSLYPENWTPPEQRDVTYADDMMIQDFSYAGYHRGEKAIPDIQGPVYNVVDYGADPSGMDDSTSAIQQAILATAETGGGVVYIPEGTYKISRQGNASSILSISNSNIVLRGAGKDKTFLWNTSTSMRSTAIIRMQRSNITKWNLTGFGSPKPEITMDLLGPTKSIPLSSVDGFSIGDHIVINSSLGDPWFEEHNVPEWNGSNFKLMYLRQIVEIDKELNIIKIDIPTRYAIKLRDFPKVYKPLPQIYESGIENLSIGNTEHPGSGFLDNDYLREGTAAYECHTSAAIRMKNVVNCWVRNVGTFSPPGNEFDHHILSNGIVITESLKVTLQNCSMMYPHFGGGGGNGYLYSTGANEILLDNCYAGFGRHNFLIAGFTASGIVYHDCFSEFTGYPGSARASDTHIALSQSNLWDRVRLKLDFLESKYRSVDYSGGFGTVFGVTQTHGVYWNTYGEEYLPGYPYIIRSDQYNFGYVIGTSGPASQVTTISDDANRTAPVDLLEGIGDGALLRPESLYDDQFEKRRVRENFTAFYSTPLNGALKNVDWMGWIFDEHYPWVFHFELGWIYTSAPTLSDYFVYLQNIGYHYTSPDFYPYFFRFSDSTWLYFNGTDEQDRRFFYNFTTSNWESY